MESKIRITTDQQDGNYKNDRYNNAQDANRNNVQLSHKVIKWKQISSPISLPVKISFETRLANRNGGSFSNESQTGGAMVWGKSHSYPWNTQQIIPV